MPGPLYYATTVNFAILDLFRALLISFLVQASNLSTRLTYFVKYGKGWGPTQRFLWPKGFRLPHDVALGSVPDSGIVTQQNTGYSWKSTLGILSLPLKDGHFPPENFSNHGNRDLWPMQSGSGQIGPGYPSTSFFCFWCGYFFTTIPHRIFLLFKVSTICDEYIRYWNNGMYLSNQVNGNTHIGA